MKQASLPGRGFTLVEMMVVVSIVAILAMMALPLAELARTRQQERELREALWQIRTAIDAYKAAVDQGAIASSNSSGYPPTLAVLAQGVPDARTSGTVRRFLRRVPRDPFAPASVADEASWGLRSYESPADSPRGGADVYDVYSRSERTGSNGLPLRRW